MVNIFPDPNNPTTLTMRNIHPFAFTDEMILEWKLILGGNALMFGNGLVSEIEPYGTRTLRFNIDVEKYLKDGWAEGNQEFISMYKNALSHELIFDISLKLAKDSFYSKEGYEVAFFQEVLADEVADPIKTGKTVGSLNAFSVKRLIDDSGLPFLPSENTSEEEPQASAPVENDTEVKEEIADLTVAEGEASATEIMQEEDLENQ